MTDAEAAERLRRAVDDLNVAIEVAQDLGLRVDLNVSEIEVLCGMSRRSFATAADVSIWREVTTS